VPVVFSFMHRHHRKPAQPVTVPTTL